MKRQTGFTLIEMAIVIAIIGIVLAGLLGGLGVLRENQQFKQDQHKLNDIKTALLSYVAVNGHLPCPDTDIPANGRENRRSEGFCSATTGTLPYLDLSTHSNNSYGENYSYHINRNANQPNTANPVFSASYFGNQCIEMDAPPCFNKHTPPTANLPSTGNFSIKYNAHQLIADQVPVVVISHGRNHCQSVSGFEAENCKSTHTDTVYYQAPQKREGVDQFDDVLTWLTSLQIKHAANLVSQPDNNEISSPNGLPFNLLPDPNTLAFDHQTSNNYDADSTHISANPAERIKINGDMNRNLVLDNDETALYITGQLNALLAGGSQNKIIFINGDINHALRLAGGDNKIEVNGRINVTGSITTGNGADTLIVHGDVAGDVQLDNGMTGYYNTVYIGGEISADIRAKGTIYINQTAQQLSDTEYGHLYDFSVILCRQALASRVWVSCR